MDIKQIKKELGLTNKDFAYFFDMGYDAYANSSAKKRYEQAICRFYTVVKNQTIYKPLETKKKLTYKERIDWFYANYYETGMEHSHIYESFKDKNLDELEWYGNIVEIPKYKEDIS